MCGVVLADEMGLGKPVLCLLLSLQTAAASCRDTFQYSTCYPSTLSARGSVRFGSHVCAGALQWQPPLAPQQLCGGVLADEMGLGKTVVCLALILQNAAASHKEPGQGGTLIAATPALMGQWESEVSTVIWMQSC